MYGCLVKANNLIFKLSLLNLFLIIIINKYKSLLVSLGYK